MLCPKIYFFFALLTYLIYCKASMQGNILSSHINTNIKFHLLWKKRRKLDLHQKKKKNRYLSPFSVANDVIYQDRWVVKRRCLSINRDSEGRGPVPADCLLPGRVLRPLVTSCGEQERLSQVTFIPDLLWEQSINQLFPCMIMKKLIHHPLVRTEPC